MTKPTSDSVEDIELHKVVEAELKKFGGGYSHIYNIRNNIVSLIQSRERALLEELHKDVFNLSTWGKSSMVEGHEVLDLIEDKLKQGGEK